MGRRYEMEADEGGSFKLYTPYKAEFVDRFRAEVPSSAKKYVKNPSTGKFDHWLISAAYADPIKKLCKDVYGYAPDVVGTITTTQVKKNYPNILLEYMGLPRSRGHGEITASGWYNDGWNLIFPLSVLEKWFSFEAETPKEELTYYQVLSIKQGCTGSELKKAYRRAARTWHPDVCTEPDAEDMFKSVQEAYETLKDPQARRKYNACLTESKNIAPKSRRGKRKEDFTIGWRPPIRCGTLIVKGTEMAGRITVEEILGWEDVINFDGKTMVTSWDIALDGFKKEWV